MKTRPSKYFFSIMVVNSTIFILTLFGMMVIPFIMGENPTLAQSSMYNTIETVFKMSAGALIGLVGGKASSEKKD